MVSKFSDAAVGLSADKLGFRDYAEGVIATLESLSKEDTPFTIGIFGSWGSGKTSFMQIMQELLESRGYETIFFNSWEYGNEEKPWIPFMITVVDELFEDGVVKKDLIRNVALFSTDVVLQTGTQGRVSTGAISNLIARSRKNRVFKNWLDKDTKTVIERVTKIEEFKNKIKERAEESCLFSINIKVLDKLFYYCKLQKEALSSKFKCYLRNKYEKKMNSGTIPENLKKNFETEGFPLSDNATIRKERDDEWAITNGERIYIVKKDDGKIKIYENFEKPPKTSGYNPKVYRECNRKKGKSKHSYKESPKGKIIIFIDDLDRIPEEKIVNFLDCLKIFLDISGCIFVLGCDYEILKNALRKKHGEEEIYKDYFDKIVQTEFYIPKISEQAIKNYLQFLTGWDKEIEECTQLVIDSIGGNPRKIKRVVNATMLIKSVFEKKLATFLEAFERPKPAKMIERMGERKKENHEVLRTSENKSIRLVITPTEVFDFLFDKKMLFKLMCMREQWPAYYEDILREEKKQNDLISLQEGYIPADIQEYTGLFSTAKGQKELEENVKKLSHFLKEPPVFQGVNRRQKVVSLKTYLNFLEISSPEAGIALKWGKPEKLPLNLFNRYMLFERINKGDVDVKDIENRINQGDWKSDLKSYFFFIGVISLFGHDNLLRDLLFKDEEKLKQIVEEIRASKDPSTIGRLLHRVWEVDKGTAIYLFNKETKEKYAEKIKRTSTDPQGIGMLLYSVNLIDKKKAGALLKNTSETYAEKIKEGKIKTGLDPLIACTFLLDRVREIEEETARELLNETKDSIAEKIKASTDPSAIGWLLNSVRLIDKETAKELLKETWESYAEKIKASTDPAAIGRLLFYVREIEEETAKELLKETWGSYVEKIKASTDPAAIGWLLGSVLLIEEETAKELLKETWESYAEKIKASTDPAAIGWLLGSVRKVEEETSRGLLLQTKDSIAAKIIASSDLRAIGQLLDSVREIDPETAEWLEKETNVETKKN